MGKKIFVTKPNAYDTFCKDLVTFYVGKYEKKAVTLHHEII